MDVELDSTKLQRIDNPDQYYINICIPFILSSLSAKTQQPPASSASSIADIEKQESDSLNNENKSNNTSASDNGINAAAIDSSDISWKKEFEIIESIRSISTHDSLAFKSDEIKHAITSTASSTATADAEVYNTSTLVIRYLCAQASSLRSASARNALLAIQDYFSSFPKWFVHHDIKVLSSPAAAIGATITGTADNIYQQQLLSARSKWLNEINQLMQMLLVKSASEKKFLKDAATSSIKQISAVMYVEEEFFDILSYLVYSNKNVKSNAVIGDCLCISIESGFLKQNDVMKTRIKESITIMQALSDLATGKSIDARKPAIKCLSIIQENLGHDEFVKLGNGSTGETASASSQNTEKSKKSFDINALIDLTKQLSAKDASNDASNGRKMSIKELRMKMKAKDEEQKDLE